MNENIDLKELLKINVNLWSSIGVHVHVGHLFSWNIPFQMKKNVSGEQKFSCYNMLTIRVNLQIKHEFQNYLSIWELS